MPNWLAEIYKIRCKKMVTKKKFIAVIGGSQSIYYLKNFENMWKPWVTTDDAYNKIKDTLTSSGF